MTCMKFCFAKMGRNECYYLHQSKVEDAECFSGIVLATSIKVTSVIKLDIFVLSTK